jgi:endo-1,4-beta-xylanase
MRPEPASYSFFESDQDLGFAQRHGQELIAHHLIWGRDSWLPSWLLNGGFSRDQAIAIMRDHIATLMEHYRGKIPRWVVVNEAISLAGPNTELA